MFQALGFLPTFLKSSLNNLTACSAGRAYCWIFFPPLKLNPITPSQAPLNNNIFFSLCDVLSHLPFSSLSPATHISHCKAICNPLAISAALLCTLVHLPSVEASGIECSQSRRKSTIAGSVVLVFVPLSHSTQHGNVRSALLSSHLHERKWEEKTKHVGTSNREKLQQVKGSEEQQKCGEGGGEKIEPKVICSVGLNEE